MKQQKIVKVRGSGFQRTLDESNLKDLLNQGWKIKSTSTHSGGYSPGKTCCLGACFLPLALLGKRADTTTYVLEKDVAAKEIKEMAPKEEVEKEIESAQPKEEKKLNVWVMLCMFIATIVLFILWGTWGLLIGIVAIVVYILYSDKIEKIIKKPKKKENKNGNKKEN